MSSMDKTSSVPLGLATQVPHVLPQMDSRDVVAAGMYLKILKTSPPVMTRSIIPSYCTVKYTTSLSINFTGLQVNWASLMGIWVKEMFCASSLFLPPQTTPAEGWFGLSHVYM